MPKAVIKTIHGLQVVSKMLTIKAARPLSIISDRIVQCTRPVNSRSENLSQTKNRLDFLSYKKPDAGGQPKPIF